MEERMQRNTSVFLQLGTNLFTDLTRHLRTIWEIKILNHGLCELICGGQSFVKIPQKDILQPIRHSHLL
jgi:hypothetical protein